MLNRVKHYFNERAQKRRIDLLMTEFKKDPEMLTMSIDQYRPYCKIYRALFEYADDATYCTARVAFLHELVDYNPKGGHWKYDPILPGFPFPADALVRANIINELGYLRDLKNQASVKKHAGLKAKP